MTVTSERGEGTGSLIGDFVELLQASVNKKGTFVTVSDEIHILKNYIHLQKMRYDGHFHVDYEIGKDAGSCFVPRLILQPLVENAIRYGADRNGIRTVMICACYAKDTYGHKCVHIAVKDNGKGFPKEMLEQFYCGENGNRVGLKNVHERLKSIYGNESGLLLQNTQEGACVSFDIPEATHAE